MNERKKKVKCEKGKTLAPECIDNNGLHVSLSCPYNDVLSLMTQTFCPALCYKQLQLSHFPML